MDATTDAPPSPSDPAKRDQPAPAGPTPASGTIRIVCWSPSGLAESTDPTAIGTLAGDPTARLWIDLTDPVPEVVRAVAAELGLHPLIVADIEERNERPKVATYDEMLHIVLFDLEFRGEVQPTELDLVLSQKFLLSVHSGDCDLTARVPTHDSVAPALAKGTDFLLYVIADGVVDSYFPVLDKLADEIDDLQDRVLQDAGEWTLQRLFVLKRELLAIRRATSPAREVFNQTTNRDLSVIAPEHLVYFRDVYDHLIRVTDELDNYRELVSGTLDIYLSTVNNNLSRIMKRLTGVTVILAGIGAVAGIFGMSEAASAIGNREPSGFWLITGVMVLGATLAAIVLRRIDWI
jgi:magnesium transporter